METMSYRRAAFFLLLGSAVLAMSPRSASASDDSCPCTGQKGKNEQNPDQKNAAKPHRNMHPELQIAEPFKSSRDEADQEE